MSNIVCEGKFLGIRTRSMTCTNSLPKRRSVVKTRAPLTVVMVSCSVKCVSHNIARAVKHDQQNKERKKNTERNKTKLNPHTHTQTSHTYAQRMTRLLVVIKWDKSCYCYLLQLWNISSRRAIKATGKVAHHIVLYNRQKSIIIACFSRSNV